MGFSEDRAQGKFGQCYILIGDNPYLLWDAVEHWKSVWRQQGQKAQAPTVRTFTAPQIDFQRLQDLGTTIPLFDSLQLIVVNEVNRIPAGKQEEFAAILRGFGPATKVLLTASDLDRRKSYFKSLAALGSWEEFPRIYPEKIPGWVRHIAGEFEAVLSPEAVDLIASVYGTDLFAVHQTIERALLYVGKKRRLEVADVEIVLASEGEHDIDRLLDALAHRDLPQALAVMRALFAGGDKSVLWLSILTSRCQQLLPLAQLPPETSNPEAAKILGMHPYRVGLLREQANHFGVAGLVDGIGMIFQTDWTIKTSTIAARMAMEMLVWRLSNRHQWGSPGWMDMEIAEKRE